MKEFELPTNIRQIGGVDDRLKIYVEDYAISYLKRFAEAGGEGERLAFLISKYMVIDGQGYLFICGAVQGKFTKRDDGAEVFTDESFDHVNECLEKYFEGYEIVGWMQSQPGYGTGLNPVCADYHMNNFIQPYHGLLVVDPTEKLESFYLWEKNMSAMIEAKGYFVFYERNKGMQEYILDHRIGGVKGLTRGSASEDGDKIESPGVKERVRKFEDFSRTFSRTRGSGARGSGKTALSSGEYKRVINMLVSLSAVLLVISFIMGAGLIQSDGKISQIEDDLFAMNGAFVYVVARMNYMTDQMSFLTAQVAAQIAAQPVFAPGDDPVSGVQPNPVVYTPIVHATPTPAATPAPQIQATPQPQIQPAPTPAGTAMDTAPETADTQQGLNFNLEHLPANIQQALMATPTPPPPPAPTPNPVTGITPSPGGGLTYEAARRAMLDPYEFDFYLVQRGDTLSGIVYHHYGSTDMMEFIMEINGIDRPDMILSGRVLLLPRVGW